MPYITVHQTNGTRQLTFEDILFDRPERYNTNRRMSKGGTKTVFTDNPDTVARHLRSFSVPQLIQTLRAFNAANDYLFGQDRHKLYRTFSIPKRTGGFRTINEPLPELMGALRTLKAILEERFCAMYHTSAFAYVKGRCTIDAVRRHQQNQSKWFLKTDFSDFFGSTSEDFLWRMISMIFPFSEVVKDQEGARELRKALSLCFLDGGLPQGTPISPMLTNLISIPIDHALCNELLDRHFVYTRYADDILISSRVAFDQREVVALIESTLARFEAPYHIKPTKTRYGSSAGRNWNLGVMLNKDNQITIGNKNKNYLKAACNNYVNDRKKNVRWDIHDVLVLVGKISYYKMVEPEYITGFINWFNEKHSCNLMKMLREELK